MSDEIESTDVPQVPEDSDAEQLTLGEPEPVAEAVAEESAEEPEVEPEPEPDSADEPEVVAEPEAPVEPDVAVEPEPEAPVEEPEAAEEPEESEPASADVVEIAPEPPCSVSWVPFSAYLGLWVVLAVATFVALRTPAAAGGALWAPEYALSVYGGITLVVLGPVLALAVWLFARRTLAPECRRGLLTSSLLRAAGATFVGVILWLVALYALDLYRLSLHA